MNETAFAPKICKRSFIFTIINLFKAFLVHIFAEITINICFFTLVFLLMAESFVPDIFFVSFFCEKIFQEILKKERIVLIHAGYLFMWHVL